MKKGVIKRVISFALAGTLVVGAQMILPPVQVEAAWAWNEMTSESGYPKVPTDQISVVADSEETGAIGQDGPAAHAVDGNVNSYWHTNWHNVNPVTGTPDAIDGNNTITLTLEEPVDLAGITYLPRQQAAANNNGPITVCRVYVSYNGSAFDAPPVAESNWTYPTENWNESIAEKELLFSDSVEGVKAVKIVVDSARSTTSVPYINAAEIGLLMPKGTEEERNLVAKETEYWNEQVTAGTMAAQEEDDEWLYQVKRESTGQWENLGSDYFHPDYTPETEKLGTGSWMQSSDDQNDNFHYSKLTASQITCTFGSTDYSEVAYAWRVRGKGYYRATLVNPIGASNGIPLIVRHSSADTWNQDGEVMLPETVYNVGQIFVSKIVEAEAGDIIRIGATGANVWATGFEPAIEEVTAKEYAEQWLDDNAYILENYTDGSYSEEKVAAITTAKEALDTALAADPVDENAVVAALEDLISAVDQLSNVYVQTHYWDSEYNAGTLGEQTANDVWHYQIKAADGGWSDIAEESYYANANSSAARWLSNGSADDNYHWAVVTKTQLTPCFKAGTSQYSGVAFAWKAVEDGYAKVYFSSDASGNADLSKDAVTLTIAKGNETENTEVLKEVSIPAGGTVEKEQFTTKIVKVSAGDYLRISAAMADGDAYGVTPVVEMVSVRDYAEQYLTEMEAVEISDKPAVSAGEFDEARTALRELLSQVPAADDEEIKAAVDKLELAEANLDKYTVTYQMGDKTERIKGNYNDPITIILVRDQIPEGQKFAGWYLGEAEDVIVSSAMKYSFYVVGDMTVTAKFVPEDAQVEIPPSASISNVNTTKRDDGKFDAQFIGLLTIPEGYTINEAGLLWSPSAIENSVLDPKQGPLIEGAQIKKVNVDKVSSAYQYSVTVKSIPLGRTVHAVSFAKVTDPETGGSVWIYSTEKTATVEQ